MSRFVIFIMPLFMLFLPSCFRHVRTAQDITPCNTVSAKLDWRYGSGDIRIQTSKLNSELMDRWFLKTGYNIRNGKPRIVITEIDNRTDMYIATDMIRDIIECAAIEDGRYTVVVGDAEDEGELEFLREKILSDPKYTNQTRITPYLAKAPQFLAKIRITKAITSDRFYDYEDYRMSITLYDIETQEAIDSAFDVLNKKIRR